MVGDEWARSQPAPKQQIMLALAMTRIDSQDETTFLRRNMTRARIPPKWRKIHATLDKARSVLAGWG